MQKRNASALAWHELDTRLRELVLPVTVDIQLATSGLAEQFPQARQIILTSLDYKKAVRALISQEDINGFAPQLARAMLAMTLQLSSIQQQTELYANQRTLNELVMSLSIEFARSMHAGNIKRVGQLQQFTRSVFTRSQQERQRRILLNIFTPFIGDIIFYQARGAQLRNLILEHIRHVTPPIILLGHSLGGVACLDILVEHELPQIHSLITVASQAPLLYEMDALQSLPFGQPLPHHFPPWLNIYDMRDILSYVGAEVFPGRVTDVRVNNKQPYPQAHNSYWTNPETWNAIIPSLPVQDRS